MLCNSFFFISGDELLASIDEIRDELSSLPIYVFGKCRAELDDRYVSMDDLLLVANPVPICKVFRQSVSPLHPICYIYTSGTTGKFHYINFSPRS